MNLRGYGVHRKELARMLDTTPPNVAREFEHMAPLAIPWALRLFGAIFIIVLGVWLSGKGEYFTARMLGRTRHFDQMLRDFLANIVRYFILTITGLTVLSQFGVQTTSLVAVIGAASLAIGLALQGTLSNLAAGVMLLIFRPFKIGHHIQVGGNAGTVKELTMFWTEVITDDNIQIIIPNSSVWGQALKNLTTYGGPAGTVEIRFPVPDMAKLNETRDKVRDLVTANANIAKTPPPTVLFDRSPTDNTLQLVVKFLPSSGNADAIKSEVIEHSQAVIEAPATQNT
jgi:small conductance mechanosensitive channel